MKINNVSDSLMLQPQEVLMVSRKGNSKYSIGVPKEVNGNEYRVPITPLSVELLIANGHQVFIESNAGQGANFSDADYANKGATIVYENRDVYCANIILKIEPPTVEEVKLMHRNQYLISSIQINDLSKEVLQVLVQKKVTALAFELLKDESSVPSIMRAMSEIAGAESVMIAAEYLGKNQGGKGLLLGCITGVPPTEIVILGAGVVAENIAKVALALGADVKVFDESLERLRRLQKNVGQKLYTSIIQTLILEKAIKKCDVVFGAIRAKRTHSPCIISEELVKKMKANAILVDLSITQGGCFETSELRTLQNPSFTKHGVIHYCIPNIASRVPRTASYALTNILTPLILRIGRGGNFSEIISDNIDIRDAVYLHQGQITEKKIAQKFSFLYKDLSLLNSSNY